MKNIINERYINEEMLMIRINLIEGEIWTLIVAYREGADERKEDNDPFYEDLQRKIDEGQENLIIG